MFEVSRWSNIPRRLQKLSPSNSSFGSVDGEQANFKDSFSEGIDRKPYQHQETDGNGIPHIVLKYEGKGCSPPIPLKKKLEKICSRLCRSGF